MSGSDYIAADPQRLLAGGIDMAGVSEIIEQLYEEMDYTAGHFSYAAGGGDHIAKLLEEVYEPSERACAEFVRILSELILRHGEAVAGSGKVLAGADVDATTAVTGGKRSGS